MDTAKPDRAFQLLTALYSTKMCLFKAQHALEKDLPYAWEIRDIEQTIAMIDRTINMFAQTFKEQIMLEDGSAAEEHWVK